MSLYNYVDSPNSNLICCICRMPFTDPTTTNTCVHTFCRDCIIQAIQHSPQCPIDRSSLTHADLAPANPIVRSLVDELVVECVHHAEGCVYMCQRQHLARHLLDSCPYRESQRSREEDGESSILNDGDSKGHVQDGIQSDSTTEERSHLTNPLTSSDSPKLAALTEQNIILRQRIEGLEGHLLSHNRELVAIERALGPWYRPGDGAARCYSVESPVGVQHSSATTSGMSTRPGVNSPYRHPYPSIASPGVTVPSVDPLAAYFPPDSEEFERTSSRLDAHTTFHPQRAYAHSPMIAPLDLSTTLEGSLHGLRESLAGLAASVDSMGRRHEIALSNETARMVEEVGGLRAGLHGLRMQIHAIMMDRNAQLTGRDGVGEGGAEQWMPLPVPPARMYHAQPLSITKL